MTFKITKNYNKIVDEIVKASRFLYFFEWPATNQI